MSKLTDLKQFIIDEFIPDSHIDKISNDLDLIQNGILDSLAVLKLIAFIEDNFNIFFDPDEIDPDNLKSINTINNFIAKKNELS